MNISLQIVVEWMWKVADFNHSKCTSSISIVPKIKHICQSPVRLTLVYQISLWYLRSWLPPVGSAESETWLKLLTDLLQFKGRPRGRKSNSWNVQEPSLKALLLTPRSGRTRAGFHSFRIIRKAWRLESHVNVWVRNSVKKQNETRLLCAKGKSNRCKKCWVVLCAQGAPFYTNGFCILVLSRTKGPFSERSSSQIMTATPFYCSDLHRLKISSKQITFGKK